jgi:hypothetical protein
MGIGFLKFENSTIGRRLVGWLGIHSDCVVGDIISNFLPSPHNSHNVLSLKMTTTEKAERLAESYECGQATERSDSGDEDVFHDARFPAEEETVSNRDFQISIAPPLLRG